MHLLCATYSALYFQSSLHWIPWQILELPLEQLCFTFKKYVALLKNHCAKWSVSLLHRCPHSIVVLHVNFHPVCIVCLSKQPGEWHSSSSFKSSFQHRSLKEPKVCFNIRHCLDGQTCCPQMLVQRANNLLLFNDLTKFLYNCLHKLPVQQNFWLSTTISTH